MDAATTARRGPAARYAPIGEHALLGDRHGSALVTRAGRVDWLAGPSIDTPPLISGILDADDGGHLVLEPAEPFEVRRRYLPGTMALETEFTTASGSLKVTDVLTEGFQGRLPWTELARRVEADGGAVPVRWELRPGTRLARVRPWVHDPDLIGYDGPFAEAAVRSALVIKALSSLDTGALAAAPTTSLPEAVGGERNFDYRYAWVRDASDMIDALSRLGLTEEVDASLAWLLRCVQQTAPDVHVFYTLDGRPAPPDQDRTELVDGYRGSRPVTIGNKAAGQTQHGSYGDLFGAVARYVDQGGHLDTGTGQTLTKLADRLCDEWTRPDAGLWELGRYRRYTSSLINAWAALDSAVKLAEGNQIPDFHAPRWRESRSDVHDFVDRHCWSEAKQSYTFYAGTEELDAAVLLAARCGFAPGDDPRLWTTIDAIRRELTAEGPLLYRYSGAGQEENAFVACTFWLIEAMSIAGRAEEAGRLIESALRRGNDLGLWSEEIDPSDGSLTGNFPIGISHLAVIGAITAYARALERGRDGATPTAG